MNIALDLVNKANKAIFGSESDDVIYDGNTVLNAVDNGQHFDVICKMDNKMRFVRIIFKEYASEDGETFYLKAQCIDLNTGENLNYGDIVEAIHE